jgi:ribosomal protein S18 acetylase RimI-like enzyme
MTVSAADVLEILDVFEGAGIVVWIDGGWGIDALVGEQTREHDDLDIVIDIEDVDRLKDVLTAHGFTKLTRWPDSPDGFVLGGGRDRRVDVHPVRFTEEGAGLQRLSKGEWTFPAEGFAGRGTIGGRTVRCLTAEVQVLCHAGYELDDGDLDDLALLRDRLGAELLEPQQRAFIERIVRAVEVAGVESLKIDDLVRDDLPLIAWSGSPSHVRNVAGLLDRVPSGEVEYLAVRAPDGFPIAKGCVVYGFREDAGDIEQLATHELLGGRGIATRLIGALEERIRARGVRWAVLGVEDDNPRARALYERLGYTAYGRDSASWETDRGMYETELTLLRKEL